MAVIRSIVARIQSVFAWWFADIRRRPSTLGKAASLLIGLFILCCVCSVGYSAVRSTGQAIGMVATNTPSPQPTSTLAPTITPAPTNTPEPSATPPPTNTPEPTAIPTPAPSTTPAPPTDTPAPTDIPPPPPTEAPKLTTDERQAVTDMGTQLSNIGQGLTKIGELAQETQMTDVWKIQMAAAIVMVQSGHAVIVKMNVPPKIKPLHSAVVAATTDCNAAMGKLASGIDNLSTRDIQAGGVLMRSCGQKIKDAQPELDTLRAQF
jgi:hypothetical protein